MKNEANAEKSLGQIIWDALAPLPTAESCERAGKLVEAAVAARQPGLCACSGCKKQVPNAWRDADGNWCLTCLAGQRNEARQAAAPGGAVLSEEVVEGLAKVVYEGMFRGAKEAGDTPPEWVERGNSDMQYAARKLARLYLDSHPEFFVPTYYVTAERPPTEADGDGLGDVLAWYMGPQASQWIRVSWMDGDFARGKQPYWMPLPPAPVPAKTTEDEQFEANLFDYNLTALDEKTKANVRGLWIELTRRAERKGGQ